MKKYCIIYIDRKGILMDRIFYNDLNKAISDIIYWKNNICTKDRLSIAYICNVEKSEIISIIPNS